MKAVAMVLVLVGMAFAQDKPATDSETKRLVLNKLETMKISLSEVDRPLDELVAYLRDFSNINFLIDPEVYTKVSKDQMRVTIKVKDVRLKSALKLILGQYDLAAVYQDGIVRITTRERVNQNVITQFYDVRDLLLKISNFPGPKLELTGGEGSGGSTGITFTVEEPQQSKVDEGFLEELIKTNTGGKSWEENPNAAVRITPTGILIVTQTRAVHKEVENLLNMLRHYK